MSDLSASFLSHFEENRKKYLIAATGLITLGGCYLIYQAYTNNANTESNDTTVTQSKVAYTPQSVQPSNPSNPSPIDTDTKEDDTSTSTRPTYTRVQSIPNADDHTFPVRVFVRIRPLVGKEIIQKHQLLDYELVSVEPSKKSKNNSIPTPPKQAILVKDPASENAIFKRPSKRYEGFEWILSPTDDNYSCFTICVEPYVKTILRGESTCLFAYGHTGSGKTHTIFGYNKDPGMYLLFAREMYKRIKIMPQEKGKECIVQVRFTELFQNKLFDLLSEDKIEVFVREDGKGIVHVRTDPVKSPEDGKVRQLPVTSIECNDEESLLKTVSSGVGSRNVGKSTLHDKSSRSHAFLEFEIVSRELITKREELVEMDAEILRKELELDPMNPKVKKLKMKRKELAQGIKKLLNDDSAPYIGGKMTFVDLAGNEYQRDALPEEDEEINKSRMELLAGMTEEQREEQEKKMEIRKNINNGTRTKRKS